VTTGIILLRFKSAAADLRLEIVKHHWPEISRFAPGSFVVVSQDRLRVRRLSASKF
jgi:hypothetical protein